MDDGTKQPVSSEAPAYIVPSYNWHAHWLTVNEFSRMMGRRPYTIHTWLRRGTLMEFGIPVMQFRNGHKHSGRTFIQNVF